VDKLVAILKDNKKLIVSLQKLANTLAEQAEKAQETILNVELSVELSVEQKVQSLTCMRMPYSYQLDALTEFGQNALLLCTQPQPLVQVDMRFYFASKRIIEPPTIGENDPGRTSAYAAYYGNEQKRKLGTKEYYAHGGQGSRAKKMERKKLKNLPGGRSISDIESNIPSCKSTSVSDYVAWMNYVLLNLKYLFDFYNFENTAENRWQNFVSKQASIEESVNILINGGKKYAGNKRRRRETRKRKKEPQSLAGPPAPSTPSISQLNLDQAPQQHK
jgi:hypothetical protein